MARNQLTPADVISVVFTATPDLNAEFPGARRAQAGVPGRARCCAAPRSTVPGAMPRVVRLLMHVETGQPRSAMQHVYLRGAAALRLDIAQ